MASFSAGIKVAHATSLSPVLQCVAVCCSVLQCVPEYYSVLQRVVE